MHKPVISLALLLVVSGIPAATSALPADMSDIEAPFASRFLDSPPASAPAPVAVKPQQAPVATPERTPSANPLWAIPLATLSNTRERPIFSPSRRPPPPPVVFVPEVKAPPPPPPKPRLAERPQLSLVGTVASGEQSFGIFLDAARAALRLKVGEDFQGWKLQSVQGRDVTFERDRQITILSLPQPDAGADGQPRVQAEAETTQGFQGFLTFQPQRGGVR